MDWTSDQPTYTGVRILTFDITYRNDGPEVQPAGARVSLTLFYSGYWDSPSISNNPSNIPLTFVGRTEETGVTNLGEPALVLSGPGPSGRRLQWGRPSPGLPGAAAQSPCFWAAYPIRPSLGLRTNGRIPGTCQDINLANNDDSANNLFYIDNSANN